MNILLPIPALALLALLAGCAGTPIGPEAEPKAVAWPNFEPARPDETAFEVDSDSSELLIRVDPEGPMARLGHSHVIGGNVISGRVIVHDRSGDARLDLEIDAAAMEVDKPRWRRMLGLKPDLDADAIAGTLANMRGERVLDVNRFPTIEIRSTDVAGPDWMPTVTAHIRLKGALREISVPVAVTLSGDHLQAIGSFELVQSDFGMEPFSAVGGALRVSDRMQIRFRIVARAGPDGVESARGCAADVAMMRDRSRSLG